MALHSILEGIPCPENKGKVGDDICLQCPHFEGYVDKYKSNGLLLKFTKNKKDASSIFEHYFYICNDYGIQE